MMRSIHGAVEAPLCCAATILFGTMAGFFWTFSNAVVPGLMATTDPVGAVAMQQINTAVRNPVFSFFFFGSNFAALALLVHSIAGGFSLKSFIKLVAAVVFFFGAFFITVTGNVPLNRGFDDFEFEISIVSNKQTSFFIDWLYWNNIRCISSFFSFITILLYMIYFPIKR